MLLTSVFIVHLEKVSFLLLLDLLELHQTTAPQNVLRNLAHALIPHKHVHHSLKVQFYVVWVFLLVGFRHDSLLSLFLFLTVFRR